MIKRRLLTALVSAAIIATSSVTEAKTWSMRDCINYALANNITLQKNTLTRLSAIEDVKQSQAALLPSLSFQTSQNVTHRPWPETGRYTVANGYAEASVDKTYYNGSYSLSANWTVWNGGQNTKRVKLNKMTAQQATLDSAVTANSLIEQIAQLYVQILYSTEAINVNKQSLATSQKNEERGREMVEVGKMSRADLAQLTAQRAQDEYNIVQSQSGLLEYKRQLKKLLQITNDEPFDIAIPATTDDMALTAIPAMTEVYGSALESRPEIANAQLGIQSSELSVKMAKAQRMPTVSANAGVGTNTSSMSDNAWGAQLKNNFDVGAGITVSVPIFDNRATKTAVNKANIQRQNYMLDLKNAQTTLYSTIESYWIQATNNQNQFKAAKISTHSAQQSYDLLSEQFQLGLKNIVELMTGKDKLLAAKQNELQSKYLAILNIDMLKFYKDGEMK